MHRTPPQCIGLRLHDHTLPGDLHVATAMDTFLMYAHPQRQTHTKKHTFQLAYRLTMLEYMGAALCVIICCANGVTPPPVLPLPLIGGSPP